VLPGDGLQQQQRQGAMTDSDDEFYDCDTDEGLFNLLLTPLHHYTVNLKKSMSLDIRS